MILCPANGADALKKFNGNDGPFDASQVAVYQDNVQSFQHHRTGDRPYIDIVPYVVMANGTTSQLLTELERRVTIWRLTGFLSLSGKSFARSFM
jgi:hypothetical protein